MNLKRLAFAVWTSDPVWMFVCAMVGGMIVLLLVLPGCAGSRTEAVDARLEQSIEALDQARADLGAAEAGSEQSAAAMAEVERLRKEVLELGEARAKALAADTEGAGVDAFWAAILALVAGPGAAVGLNVHRNSTRKTELAHNARYVENENGRTREEMRRLEERLRRVEDRPQR